MLSVVKTNLSKIKQSDNAFKSLSIIKILSYKKRIKIVTASVHVLIYSFFASPVINKNQFSSQCWTHKNFFWTHNRTDKKLMCPDFFKCNHPVVLGWTHRTQYLDLIYIIIFSYIKIFLYI